MRRRIAVALATVAMFAAVLTVARMATTPSMALLYSGLESGPAGEIVRSLEQRGAQYEVRGAAIFVELGQRDELRMTLASEGLPANNTRGYELLDSLSGFGTTSQMFNAAYWRAKEGELARTITVNPQITSARVHIANVSSSPFQRASKPSASVSIVAKSGVLTAEHAQALKHLVSAAVTGLAPGDVAVIDGIGGLIGGSDELAISSNFDERADRMRQKVERLLEARVGRGNAVVEISVGTVTESEMIRERVFDPEGRVVISTDSEERTTKSKDSGGGDVTVASNLPDGDAASDDSTSSQNNETRERINYEISETHREITREPGAIKRLTVAVLVNGVPAEGGEAAMLPRPEDELRALKDLVSSAVGYDESRGDVITIKSMNFLPLTPVGGMPVGGMFSGFRLDLMSLLKIGVLAVVSLVLGLFVVRPILVKSQPSALSELASSRVGSMATSEAREPAGNRNELTPLTGMIDDGNGEFPDVSIAGGLHPVDNPELPPMSIQDGSLEPVERLRALIGERQSETVEILRSWLEDKEENA